MKSIVFVVAALCVSCSAMREPDLSAARSLRIAYTIEDGGEGAILNRLLVVEDAKEVQELVDAIEIEETKKGAHPGLVPLGSVEFNFADGKVVKTEFVRADGIYRLKWGMIFLRTRFYDAVNARLSKAEGRPIDILQRN